MEKFVVKYLYVHNWSFHYNHSKRNDCIQILILASIAIMSQESREFLSWLEGCCNTLSRLSCLSHYTLTSPPLLSLSLSLSLCLSLSLSPSLSLSLSLALRPKLSLCDHTEGLQQRRRGHSCVWERHHQTTVRYETRISLLTWKSFGLFHSETVQERN